MATDKRCADCGTVNKYLRPIWSQSGGTGIVVDVYAVLEAFAVTCPARQHAIKKLLCAGLRGDKDAVQDLEEAGVAVVRAVEMQRARDNQAPIAERR